MSLTTSQLKLSRDRGNELNQRRLKGVEIDVVFKVEDSRVQAHKFIIAMFSPYLRALTNPRMDFVESSLDEIELKSLPAAQFSEVIEFMYTGQILIHEDNVFDYIDIAEYLQINQTELVDGCIKLLASQLKSCDLGTLFKVWNVSEQYGYSELKAKVLKTLERRLNEFIGKDFFVFLGYEEIKQVLSLKSLCVGSEKLLFDTLIQWGQRSRSGDDEDFPELFLNLVSLVKFPLLSQTHVQKSLQSVVPDTSSLFQQKNKMAAELRSCSDCIYVFEYSRSDEEILGIKEFIAERRSKPTYAYYDLARDTCSILEAFTQSKSYFQHFGPHSVTDFSLLSTSRELMTLGGFKKSGSISGEVNVFALLSGSWLQLNIKLPVNLTEFGATFNADEDVIYIFGGFSDEYMSSPLRTMHLNKNLNVSQNVYKIRKEAFFHNSAGRSCGWKSLAKMPVPRIRFATVRLDSKVYLIGHDFCDLFDLKSETWHEMTGPPRSLGPKPVAASVGSRVFVFGDRPEEGLNNFYSFESTSASAAWSPIPGLGVRQDVIDAFTHNNLLYLVGWQRQSKTMMHEFNPLTETWRTLITNLSGTVRPGTVLRKYLINERSFFETQELLKYKTEALEATRIKMPAVSQR